jgi:hypothetical protein
MKSLAIVTACALTLLSLSGCGCCTYMGKGKAPPPMMAAPPPVVTKG